MSDPGDEFFFACVFEYERSQAGDTNRRFLYVFCQDLTKWIALCSPCQAASSSSVGMKKLRELKEFVAVEGKDRLDSELACLEMYCDKWAKRLTCLWKWVDGHWRHQNCDMLCWGCWFHQRSKRRRAGVKCSSVCCMAAIESYVTLVLFFLAALSPYCSALVLHARPGVWSAAPSRTMHLPRSPSWRRKCSLWKT